ncbi:MAG: nucleoside recognition domain-containing protein, partial [Thermoguttaceae bacterium]
MSKFAGPLVIAGVLWLLLCATGAGADAPAAGRSSGMGATETKAATSKDKQTPKDVGSHTKRTKRVKPKPSAYSKWKRTLPFWPRKAYLLAELGVFIIIGVLIAQMLEVSGAVKYLVWVTWPVIKLGRLGDAASPALLMSVQSGAVANGMLVSSRDRGQLNQRQLYSAVLVVSCLSLFAHLPTYVVPIGSVLGTEATIALFAVRFAAIFIEIIAILLVSNLVVYRWTDARGDKAVTVSESTSENIDSQTTHEDLRSRGEKRGFWSTVWARSWSTVRRLLIYLIPTYAIM